LDEEWYSLLGEEEIEHNNFLTQRQSNNNWF
jgi:hypothetical protein